MATENPQSYADLHGYEPCVITLNHHGEGLRPARISLALLLLLRDQCSQRLPLSSKRQSTPIMALKKSPHVRGEGKFITRRTP